MQKEYSAAIYIIGPNLKESYKIGSNFLNTHFDKVITIGDGKVDIITNGTGVLQKLYTLSDDYPELINAKKILVYVIIHGAVLDDNHVLSTSKEYWISSAESFKLLAETIKTSMDIISLPCHGKAALKEINVLPQESRIMIFSDHDKFTTAVAVHGTMDKMLSHTKFTFDGFYNNYLANISLMDEEPIVTVVGGDTIAPVALSENYLRKSISGASRQYVQNHFGQSICRGEIPCHDKIDQLMNKIEQAFNIDEFRISATTEYLEAAKVIIQMVVDYEFIINTHYEEEVIFNHKESELCYIEILDFKNKTDKLLLENGIPLELDLSHDYWYEIDYEYDADTDGLERFSNHGIYNVFKQDGFIENNDFPKPEEPEYGYVLGIIKDIHLSLLD